MCAMTIADAEAIVGTLSTPSKMPGYAYGLPASKCVVGAALAKKKGTVCSDCYALKGRYVFPNVQAAQERRLASLKDPRWVDTMVWLLKRKGCNWFRWHDSGDLQGVWHLEMLIEVARRCPEIQFWLPTREKGVVRQCLDRIPSNLLVRVSGTMIDGPAPEGFPNTSTVVRDKAQSTCPAHRQGGMCGECRKCWQREVTNVAYPRH